MNTSIWLGSRKIDDEHYNLINGLLENNLSVYGNKTYEKEGYTISNYEDFMNKKFNSDLYIIVDELWAINFGDANCKILWIKSDDAVFLSGLNIDQNLFELKYILFSSLNLINKFKNYYNFVSDKNMLLVNDYNIKNTIIDIYNESLWSPVQSVGCF